MQSPILISEIRQKVDRWLIQSISKPPSLQLGSKTNGQLPIQTEADFLNELQKNRSRMERKLEK